MERSTYNITNHMTCPRVVFHEEHCQGSVPSGSRISEDREPPKWSSSAGFDCYPLADGQRPGPRRTGGDDDATRSDDQPGSDRHESPRVAGAAHDDGVESTLKLLYGVLDPSGEDARMLEPKLSYCAREERNALLARFDENELDLTQDDLERNPGKAGTRAEIEQGAKRAGQHLEKEQAIEQQLVDDPVGLR